MNIFKRTSLFLCLLLLLICGVSACGKPAQQEAAGLFQTESSIGLDMQEENVLAEQGTLEETESLAEQSSQEEIESLPEQNTQKETESFAEQGTQEEAESLAENGTQKKEEVSTEQKSDEKADNKSEGEKAGVKVEKGGFYNSKEEVAAYLHEYGELPSNFITKKEAKKLGWVSNEGNLKEVAPGKSIGGDYFGNYEGLLPEKKGRDYYECDINTDGSYRGAERIVFSNDGLIYYTGDHYDTFELLYGEE